MTTQNPSAIYTHSIPPPPGGSSHVRLATRVGVGPVWWLWENHIALGKLTVVAGGSNVGKSLMVAGDFAARVSTGRDWPDGSPCDAGEVLIAASQDAAEDTLVPWLDSHGADRERIHLMEHLPGALGPFSATQRMFEYGGLQSLHRALIDRPNLKLVVIDPVSSILDGANSAGSRCVLSALASIAWEYLVAFILVSPVRERAPGAPAFAESSALFTAARSVWTLARDPDNRQRRLFTPAKNNLGGECPGYAWRLVDGKVQWEAQALQANDDADGPSGERRNRGKLHKLAADFIADFLADGPRMWIVIEHHAKLAGLRTATLERARGSVAEWFKRPQDDRWLWRLIGDDRTWSEGDIADMLSGEKLGLRASARSRSAFAEPSMSGIGSHIDGIEGGQDEEEDVPK